MLKFFVTLSLFAFLWALSSCNSNQNKPKEIVVGEPVFLFDIPVDSFLVEKEKVKSNQNLSDILLSENVSYQRIAQLVALTKPIFDVRKIKAGNNYYLFKDPDSLQRLRYLAYEKNRVEYVVFDLNDTLRAIAGNKDIVRVIDTATGTINSSLWNALVDNNTDVELANELSDIYSWTIDFFGIQKGDTYRIYYEELVVDKDTFGIGQVFAARFNHMGKDYNAYYLSLIHI